MVRGLEKFAGLKGMATCLAGELWGVIKASDPTNDNSAALARIVDLLDGSLREA
jgi:hypothetical protein